MKPDFLIIGAQKCATSWLHFHLRKHPKIMLPSDKDVEFFSYTVNLNPETSTAWLERFGGAVAGMRVGDVNGAYFWTETGSPWSIRLDGFNRRIPESVRAFLGDGIQLIVSLRDPAKRAVSAYLHHIFHGAIDPGQKLLDIDAPLGIVDMGFYGAHLQNWLRTYPANRFLVIRDLPFDRRSATALLTGTLEFLGVAPFREGNQTEKPISPGIPRIFRPDGVWVPEEHPSIASHLPLSRSVPGMTADGTRYTRLVDGPELIRLEQIFERDQAILNELLSAPEITVLDPRTAARQASGS